MSRRLPRPANPIRARCELSADELRAVEDAAHLCRLSVASFIRVALIEAAAHPERAEAWQEVAAQLSDAASAGGQQRPGRPPVPPAKQADKKSKGKK